MAVIFSGRKPLENEAKKAPRKTEENEPKNELENEAKNEAENQPAKRPVRRSKKSVRVHVEEAVKAVSEEAVNNDTTEEAPINSFDALVYDSQRDVEFDKAVDELKDND